LLHSWLLPWRDDMPVGVSSAGANRDFGSEYQGSRT